MLCVNTSKIFDPKKHKNRVFGYTDIPYDADGWVDAKKYRPGAYDLISMKTDSKTYSGWWSGERWDGRKIPPDADVLYWKRIWQ